MNSAADLPQYLAERDDLANMTERDLRVYLRNLPNQGPIIVERSIQAVPAGDTEAKLLEVKAGHPILSIEVTYKDVDGNPLEHLRANYRGESFKFQLNN